MKDFKTKKSLGQNFLQNHQILERIIDKANINKDNNILEIGPGQGALTDYLVNNANDILAVEIDNRLISFLENRYQENSNFKLLHKDFMDTKQEDFNFINDKPHEVKMVANLPYYLTTPIILKTLFEYTFVEEMFLMVQKEVAERFTSEFKKKAYGSITVFLQTIAEVKYEFTVPKEDFKPIPKIDSAIISIKRNNDSKIAFADFEKYEEFLKLCFKQKRKVLVNNLSSDKTLNKSKDKVLTFLEENGLTSKTRPEEIKVDEYIKLFPKWQTFISE